MFYPGLVSITFRQLEPRRIVELVREAGLRGIEWGGDVHVPHGEVETARGVAAMTADAGLVVSSYGSYYRVGESQDEGPSFEAVLETAVALGAPLIRVWAGQRDAEEANEVYWQKVIAESQRIAEMADDAGLELAYEWHGGTLTNTDDAALRLLREVNHSRVGTYWQPRGTDREALAELRRVLPWLRNIHAFCWEGGERRPLAEGEEKWMRYLLAAGHTNRDHWVLLEFVADDRPEQFREDARTLRRLLERLS